MADPCLSPVGGFLFRILGFFLYFLQDGEAAVTS
jgi:hypothetical protein